MRRLVLGGARGAELVKDVVVSLRVGDGHRSRLFEQVRLDVGARHRAARLKVEAHHLAEAGRVVVAHLRRAKVVRGGDGRTVSTTVGARGAGGTRVRDEARFRRGWVLGGGAGGERARVRGQRDAGRVRGGVGEFGGNGARL